MGYSGKAVKGLGWVGFLQILMKGSTFVKYIIIARLLIPAELGLFAVAMLTVNLFESISETGVSAFLIQTDESEDKYISTTWIVTIVRGVLLCLLTVLVAYPVSVFFNSSSSFPLILIVSIIPLVRGFANPSVAKFQKHLNFNKEFAYRMLITIFDFFVSVILVIIFKNSFGLIYAIIFSTFFETIVSLLFIKPKPKLVFEIKKIKQIFQFGKWITLITSTNYFGQQLDSIVVGKILGIESLGIYQLSQKFSFQIMADAGNIFSRVTFPLFSKIKNDLIRTKRALAIILVTVSLLFGSMTVFLLLFSKPLLLIFVGSKWLAADIPLKIFSVTGLITAFMAVITSLFLAHTKQDITAKIIVIRLVILGIIIIPASLIFGIIGASTASLISYIIVLPLAVFGLKQILYKK